MPTVGSVHVSAALSNLAIKYKNPNFVADKVAPVIPVKKESDRYYIFSREELRDMDSLRAPGAEANEVSWDVTNATYTAEEHALKHLIPDRIAANADAPIKPRATTTEKLTKWIGLGYEKRVQAIAQSTTTVTNNATPSTKWDAASGQDPEQDVDTAKESVRSTAGAEANTILMSKAVWRALRRWMKDQTTNMTYQEFIAAGKPPPKIWDLDLLVGGSVENTADEGQTDNIADIWDDNVVVFYREMAPSIQALSFMYTFRSRNFRVKSWRVEERDGEMIETSVIQDEVAVAADAAYLITDTLA
jgi:hypothetical protein